MLFCALLISPRLALPYLNAELPLRVLDEFMGLLGLFCELKEF